ncbi:protein translocase subunit SecD [Cryobacterium sp. BB736]|uniref:protein translocase subunit SecD n=1 Tax=Cryobacterium sp. BB736 TaxID=2746963 RepID=UPI0018743CD9
MAARSTPVKRAWRTLTWLLVIVLGLVALNGAAVIWGGGSWTPKLALDLEGGTQIILAPQLESGQAVTQEQLDQAVSIIRQRVDASGVAEAEISTQSGQNVIVSIPGVPDDETMERLEASAKLEFRPVLVADVSATSAMGEDGEPSPSPSPSAPPAEEPAAEPSVTPTDASDLNWITPALQEEFTNFTCDTIDEAAMAVAPDDKPLITCDDTLQFKYILGPVEVSGERIADAQAALVANSQGVSTGQWGVNIVFDGEGTKEFGDVTKRLFQLQGSQNQFAVVLDGKVITAPTTNAVITDGKPQITGSFTQETAKTLADQLKFGALPIGFVVQSQDTISATLGESQLQSGLLAGLIGLILVVIYSLIQYRTLGSVTVVSLMVAAIITYLLVTILSWREGYRLSLAGVAGLIVAVGITADSFIVYFERIRDELRDGRALVSAVEAGWKRALRTIFASDTVNFLAAAVLFLLAVGNVRGFAFTLGLTTLVDLLVVSMFTHPVMQLLAQTKFFGEGHRFSGLDPRALGAVYRGRAQFRDPVAVPASKRASSSREAAKRQTIAERKAAEKVSSVSTGSTSTSAKNSSAKKNAGKDS